MPHIVPCRPHRLRSRGVQIVLGLALGAGVAAGVAAVLWPATAHEAPGHRTLVACITTDLDAPVHFQYRVPASRGWVDAVVVQGQWQRIELEAETEESSDAEESTQALVRFDDDPDEGVRLVGQRIDVTAATGSVCSAAQAGYVFRERDAELFLDPADDEPNTSASDRPPQGNLLGAARWV